MNSMPKKNLEIFLIKTIFISVYVAKNCQSLSIGTCSEGTLF